VLANAFAATPLDLPGARISPRNVRERVLSVSFSWDTLVATVAKLRAEWILSINASSDGAPLWRIRAAFLLPFPPSLFLSFVSLICIKILTWIRTQMLSE